MLPPDHFTFTVTESGCTLTEYNGVATAGKVRVPQEVDGHVVTAIGADAEATRAFFKRRNKI